MHQDRLLEILFERLEKANDTKESEDELIYHASAQYIVELMSLGNIPHYFLDALEKDLQEELRDMYRKRTYGAMNPQEYSEARAKKHAKRRKVL